MAGRGDGELAKLMDRFVCVRVVQVQELDLSLFQFDWRTTLTMFTVAPDRTVYARFASRGPGDLERLRKVLAGSLEFHERRPEGLEGKTGRPLPWTRPEEMKKFGKVRRYEGHGKCIHCHNIGDELRKSFKKRKGDATAASSWPNLARIGVGFEAAARATVSQVLPESRAADAGLRKGDAVLLAGGQPVLSIADVEWAFHRDGDSGEIPLEVERDGKRVPLTVRLPDGWRGR